MALDPKKRERHREYMRMRYQNDPEHRRKQKARTAVGHAIRDGLIEKKPCEVCGSVKSFASHDDYDKPLAIRWLCRGCPKPTAAAEASAVPAPSHA